MLVRRRTRPDIHPRFVGPLGPVVPVLGMGFCAYLLHSLGWATMTITAAILVSAAVTQAREEQAHIWRRS